MSWQVVDAPEVLTVIGSVPHLKEYLNSLYGCQYKDFFKVGSMGLHWISRAGGSKVAVQVARHPRA